MHHTHRWLKAHRADVGRHAPRQIAIFVRVSEKSIKTTDRHERASPIRDVAGKKTPPNVIGHGVLIERVVGGRTGVASDARVFRVCLEKRNSRTQPTTLHARVVVSEEHNGAARVRDAAITSHRGALTSAPHQFHSIEIRETVGNNRAIVHDDDLDVSRQSLDLDAQALQRPLQ
jgi:hypothetical protein